MYNLYNLNAQTGNTTFLNLIQAIVNELFYLLQNFDKFSRLEKTGTLPHAIEKNSEKANYRVKQMHLGETKFPYPREKKELCGLE